MIKLFFPIVLAFSLSTLSLSYSYAQAPKGINYQGVARDSDGKPIISKNISVRIGILKNAALGEVEYSETHKLQTNQFGLFTLVIGQGTVNTGAFSFVSWAVGKKWLQVELDPDGGSLFQLAGSQQLMSVPYAFYAEYAGNGGGASSLSAGQGIAINDGVILNTGDGDNSITNEIQTLSIAAATDGNNLSISGGNTVVIKTTLVQVLAANPDAGGKRITNLGAPTNNTDAVTKNYVDAQNALDLDIDPSNELQTFSQVLAKGNDAGAQKITNLGTPTAASDAATKSYVDAQNALDLDTDPINEIQNLTQVLAKGNDAGTQRITNLGTPTAASDAATKSYVDAQNALDTAASATNEIQDLALNTTTNILKITNNAAASDINLTPYKQTLTYTPATNNLAISGGNNVAISHTLAQVLTTNANAGGIRIQNVGAPTTSTDVTTKGYVDNAIATNYAFKANFNFSNSSGSSLNDQEMIFTSEEFDSFNVLSGNSFTALESGTYVFMIDGVYNTSISGGQISLLYNSIKRSIPIVLPFGSTIPRYNATFMFQLMAGQTVKVIGDNVLNGASFTGYFFGYKL